MSQGLAEYGDTCFKSQQSRGGGKGITGSRPAWGLQGKNLSFFFFFQKKKEKRKKSSMVPRPQSLVSHLLESSLESLDSYGDCLLSQGPDTSIVFTCGPVPCFPG